MEALIHVDMPVVVWLYAGCGDVLFQPAREAIETEDVAMSPVVFLELEHLQEAGKTTDSAAVVLGELEQRIGLRVADTQLLAVTFRAQRQTWTRDPFDRIIVGQAEAKERELVACDRSIREHYQRALW